MQMKKIHKNFIKFLSEEYDVPSKMEKELEGPLPAPQDDRERNLKMALRVIEAEGYDYKIVKNQIRVLDDHRIETMNKLRQMLEPLGFQYNPIGGGSSIGRLEMRDRKFGSVYVLVKPKKRTAASAGMDFEAQLANEITSRYEEVGITATTAGFGHGSDLTIHKGGKPVMTIELKTALSADFGQFRVQYNLDSNSWEPRRTTAYKKNEAIFGPLFDDYLKTWLNNNASFNNINDKRLNIRKEDISAEDSPPQITNSIVGLKSSMKTGELKRELQSQWFNGKTDVKMPFDFDRIASYYADKGDSFIQIDGTGLYALKPKAQAIVPVPMFGDLGLKCDLRFRFKPSAGENSNTSFTVAVKIKGRYKKSPISLTNASDLDMIVKSLL
jgi:hypothetical protein